MATNARIVTMQIPEELYNDVVEYLRVQVSADRDRPDQWATNYQIKLGDVVEKTVTPQGLIDRLKAETVKLTQFVPKN